MAHSKGASKSRTGKTTALNRSRTKNSRTKDVNVSQARDYYDYNLLAAVILLTCFGLVMLYSTSAYEASVNYNNDMFFFGKQALVSAVSIAAMIVGSRIDYHKYLRYIPFLYGLSILLLIATRFIGTEVNGAKRWIRLGGLSFQPAELAKLAVILFLSQVLVMMGGKMKGIKAPLVVLMLGGLSAGCTYLFTENLSTGIIIAAISFVLVFIVHPKTAPFIMTIIGGIITVGLGLWFIIPKLNSGTSSFRLKRIMVWLHPEDYKDQGGYQVIQGLYAIGSGGFFGKGLGNSTQKLGALPEAQNDMIFAIICEELGMFGAMIVILLFVFLLYRLFVIARNAPDLFGSLIASGIFVHIALQLVLNIAVVTNMIPTTGITLPFVSYGGSSIMFLMAEMMVALSVSAQIKLR